jgi:DNA-binding MarR family transcriptional regulator
MADLADLTGKQADAAAFASRMVEEKDPERLKEMAEELQSRCSALAKMARSLEAALAPAGTSGPETRVVLTPEQRKRVAEQTGVGVEVVTLRDSPARPWSRQMATVEPREVEAMAAKQAAASRLKAETRERVEKIIRELEKLDVPELAETISELRRDPTLGLSE